MRKVFLTFGAGRFLPAVDRISNQAAATAIFDEIKAYTPETLFYEYPDFLKHLKFLIDHPRGYGYWIWKPYLIHQTLLSLNDGDVLFYLDAGCEILPQNKDVFHAYLQRLASQDDILAFDYRGYESFNIVHWAKQDLLDRYVAELESIHFHRPQIWAGALGFQKNDHTLALVKEWYDCCIANNYHYVTDAPSVSPNKAPLIGHLHDQSIFTLVSIKYNVALAQNAFELDYSIKALKFHPACWQIAQKQPFLAMRNDSSQSFLQFCQHPLYRACSKMIYALNGRSYGGTEWLAKASAKQIAASSHHTS